MHAVRTLLLPQHSNVSGIEIKLAPLQSDQRRDAKPMRIGHQDHAAVPLTPGAADNLFNLGLGQVGPLYGIQFSILSVFTTSRTVLLTPSSC